MAEKGKLFMDQLHAELRAQNDLQKGGKSLSRGRQTALLLHLEQNGTIANGPENREYKGWGTWWLGLWQYPGNMVLNFGGRQRSLFSRLEQSGEIANAEENRGDKGWGTWSVRPQCFGEKNETISLPIPLPSQRR